MTGNDTIAAIATPPGRGAIGVVRLSGPKAAEIAGRVLSAGDLATASDRGAILGRLVDPVTGEGLDEVIVTLFLAPRSYTREEMVEIGCHGSPMVVGRLLQAVLDAGARPAAPGEFTLRAFLSGRIDLARAEAVADLISAESEAAARMAYRHLSGELSRKVEGWRSSLLELTASLEASIDFEDDGVPPFDRGDGATLCRRVAMELRVLARTQRVGALLRDGAKVVIAGRPNVGKSSLLNALAGESRVIVGPAPGTTRDTVELRRVIGGMPVTLIDTAGVHEGADPVEREGVARALEAIGDADLLLLVTDGSAPLEGEAGFAAEKPHLLIRNKADLPTFRAWLPSLCPGNRLGVHDVSAKSGDGILLLAEGIAAALAGGNEGNAGGIIVASERHRFALEGGATALERAATALDDGAPEELAAEELRSSAGALCGILGIDLAEETIQGIFSRFCVGK